MPRPTPTTPSVLAGAIAQAPRSQEVIARELGYTSSSLSKIGMGQLSPLITGEGLSLEALRLQGIQIDRAVVDQLVSEPAPLAHPMRLSAIQQVAQRYPHLRRALADALAGELGVG